MHTFCRFVWNQSNWRFQVNCWHAIWSNTFWCLHVPAEQLSDIYKMMNKSRDWSVVKMELYCLFSTVLAVIKMLFSKRQLDSKVLLEAMQQLKTEGRFGCLMLWRLHCLEIELRHGCNQPACNQFHHLHSKINFDHFKEKFILPLRNQLKFL